MKLLRILICVGIASRLAVADTNPAPCIQRGSEQRIDNVELNSDALTFCLARGACWAFDLAKRVFSIHSASPAPSDATPRARADEKSATFCPGGASSCKTIRLALG